MNSTDQDVVLSKDESEQVWIQRIQEWQESGQSISEWVRDRGDFSLSQFHHARRRLFPEDIRKNDFVENPTQWSHLTVEIPASSFDVHINGCRIVVKAGFDQELLREVVEVLKDAD
ncbi:hypothetical protein GKZ89_20655 [Bacillus mangrovi]|uniref:Uncharacterized protein n=1 Tax=Metabacillus mangrovi TaxID=1491830 RepID=A0A7X2S8W2_9BACI|nr:hypothetical protein [Metabacillus mangrovi]MTH55802.1 hypothetical protein [Metabacillus mangrovi]